MPQTYIRLDGAMGTYLHHKHKPSTKIFKQPWEALNLSHETWVQKAHLDYLQAGADIISSNTLNANRLSLQHFGLDQHTQAINTAALRLAQQALQSSGTKAQIAGVIGPGVYSLSKPNQRQYAADMQTVWKEQALLLVHAGADYLLLETMADAENARLATESIVETLSNIRCKIPLILSLSLNSKGNFYFGGTLPSFYQDIKHYPLAALGLNCMPPNGDTLKVLFYLAKLSQFPVIFYPNAGLPHANGHYNISAPQFKAYMLHIKDKLHSRLFALGGCCGTTPDYIRV